MIKTLLASAVIMFAIASTSYASFPATEKVDGLRLRARLMTSKPSAASHGFPVVQVAIRLAMLLNIRSAPLLSRRPMAWYLMV